MEADKPEPVEGSTEWYFHDLGLPPPVDPEVRERMYAMRLAAFTMALTILTVFALIWKWIF